MLCNSGATLPREVIRPGLSLFWTAQFLDLATACVQDGYHHNPISAVRKREKGGRAFPRKEQDLEVKHILSVQTTSARTAI